MYQLARYLDAAPPSPGRRSPYLPLAEKVDQFIERRRIDDPARHRGVAAGYVVYAVNPLQASRYRERHGVSGAKSDRGDAHMLTDMVRTDSHQLRAVAGDSPDADAVKVVARTHKTLSWERTRQVQRLRYQLREYFPAVVEAFADLDAPDALELLARAPDPARARRLTRAQVSAALKRRRRDIPDKATAILAALHSAQLGQPPAITAACAVTARSLIAVITVLNEQVKALESQVEADFGRHPDAEIYRSQPGLGSVPGARVPGEFGDDPHRYATGKARKNYAATSSLTRASGKKKVVTARYIRNDRLIDALMAQAFTALSVSPGARALYDTERDRGTEHNAALRKVANRLVGILHGCLKTRTLYDEATAWPPPRNQARSLTSKLLGCLSCPATADIKSGRIPAPKQADNP